MSNSDIDSEMPSHLIESYIKNIVHQFEQALRNKVERIQKDNAKVTYRKIYRLKKSILFQMLEVKKNES